MKDTEVDPGQNLTAALGSILGQQETGNIETIARQQRQRVFWLRVNRRV